MKDLLNTICFLSLILYSSSILAADKECLVGWQIASNKVLVGQRNDQLLIKENGSFQIISQLIPKITNGLSMKTTIVGNSPTKLMLKEDKVINTGKTMEVKWERLGKVQWKLTENKVFEDKLVLEDAIIDSTVFPYLLMFKMIDLTEDDHNALPNKKKNTFNFLSKNSADTIKINVEQVKDKYVKLTSSFDNSYLITDKDLNPSYIGFTYDNKLYEGTLVNFTCK